MHVWSHGVIVQAEPLAGARSWEWTEQNGID